MTCPSRRRLAAASAGEDAAAELHAESCARCRTELCEMASVVRLAREAPPPGLTASRRTELRAQVLAACDAAGVMTRRPRRGMLAAAAAIAAVIVAIAWYGRSASSRRKLAVRPQPAGIAAPTAPAAGGATRRAGDHASALVEPQPDPRLSRGAPPAASRPAPTSAPPPAASRPAPTSAPPPAASAAMSSPPPAASAAMSAAPPAASAAAPTSASPPRPARPATAHPPPARALATATVTDASGSRASDGRATIDARDTPPVRVVSGDTAITVASSKVELTSRGGAVVQVHVIIGSAEIELRGKRTIVFAGDVWVRPAPAPREQAATALSAFERGWLALREARYGDAIAAFDQAQDPVVAEDAVYWAAIACARAGDRVAAARRLRDFLARFPTAMRVDDARRALARLEAP